MYRRDFVRLASAVVWAAAVPVWAQGSKKPATEPRIVVLGDSLSAEYGLVRGTGWVALLEQRLAAEKIAASVVNASISGDTTSGGRARLGALLKQHKPTVLVIELGANDALRGLPLKNTEDNLAAMAQAAQKVGAKVILVGMQVPPNYGRQYAEQFAQLFVSVAQKNKTALVPFLLKDIADREDAAAWFQSDSIHPLAKAHPQMIDNVWPALRPLLR
jgi:acyl-CoA thioesterase-1